MVLKQKKAIVCLIRDGELFVANAGDCRAVISKAKKAIELSVDHKPHREDEKVYRFFFCFEFGFLKNKTKKKKKKNKQNETKQN